MRMNMDISPLLIPIVAVVAGTAMIVAIVWIALGSRARDKELQYHRELKVREMEHPQKMKELEIELERTRKQNASGQTP
jgi:hypothetical protein